MICYTLDAAKEAAEPGDEICVSTDDQEIIEVVEEYGFQVPFKRPDELAGDHSTTQEVIDHAVNWYRKKDITFDTVILLQPTSPLRTGIHVKEALQLWSPNVDMVVSVKETDANPYYVLFEDDEAGYLQKSKDGDFTRRQDCPKVWELNGAIYIFKVKDGEPVPAIEAKRKVKYVMDKWSSVDVDDEVDLLTIESIIRMNN